MCLLNKGALLIAMLLHCVCIATAQRTTQKKEIYPCYKVTIDQYGKPAFVRNENSNLIIQNGSLQTSFDGRSDHIPMPAAAGIIKKIPAVRVCYFRDEYSDAGFNPQLMLADSTGSFVMDFTGHNYGNAMAYIDTAYGSLDKYKEGLSVDAKRAQIKWQHHDSQQLQNTDTILLVFIDQLSAVMPIDDEMRASFFSYFKKRRQRGTDTTRGKDGYFTLYGLNITSDLLTVLTNEQFLAYKNYVDIISPLRKRGLSADKDSLKPVPDISLGYSPSQAKIYDLALLNAKRFSLTQEEIETAYQYDYRKLELEQPQDSAVVIQAFTDELKHAVHISPAQEKLILSRLEPRLKNPVTPPPVFATYDIHIYGYDITNILLGVLTDKQFIEYINYLDLYFPERS